MINEQNDNPATEQSGKPYVWPKSQFFLGEEFVWKGVRFKLAMINHSNLVIKLVDGVFDKNIKQREPVSDARKRHKRQS